MENSKQNQSKKRAVVPAERRRRIVESLWGRGAVTVTELEEEFGVSPMTARRDLDALDREGAVRRTHGGAVLPGFAGREDAFQSRLQEAVGEKERLAAAAVELLSPGETIFVDSSTTAYFAARRLLGEGVEAKVLTNSLPVMELLGLDEGHNVELAALGGGLRKLMLSFVGPATIRSIEEYFGDRSLISVKGLTADGYLTDPNPLDAEVKRRMIWRSSEPVLLVDARKLDRRGTNVICHVSEMRTLLVAGASRETTSAIGEMGVEVRHV